MLAYLFIYLICNLKYVTFLMFLDNIIWGHLFLIWYVILSNYFITGLLPVRSYCEHITSHCFQNVIHFYSFHFQNVCFLRVHYPGTKGSKVADMTGKQLWSSEDYSTFNDNVGAGCWARVSTVRFLNISRITRKCVFEHFWLGMTPTGLLSYSD